jgi:hypothetical protein
MESGNPLRDALGAGPCGATVTNDPEGIEKNVGSKSEAARSGWTDSET